jgi:putative DNA primase/helicase
MNTGIEKAHEAALAVDGIVAVPELDGRKCDFNDLHREKGPEAVRAAIAAATRQEAPGKPADGSDGWPDPEPLPELPPVAPLDYSHLPPVLRAYVKDIAERMQCPADFVAVACVAMMGAAIGRKIGIRPKRADDWTVVPNQWAMIVGRSGIMKSPALAEALAPLRKMQVDAFKDHEQALQDFETESKLHKLRIDEAGKKARKLLQKGNHEAASLELANAQSDEKEAPTAKRYIVIDSTVEALAETLEENPGGVLVYRDELSGWLRSLEKEGQQEALAFYLVAADGDKSFTTDRIGRGRGRHIEAVCVSIVGGIQPGVLGGYVRETQRGGAGDDGLLQRFGLMVYPNVSPTWVNVDRPGDHEARAAMHGLVSRLCNLTPQKIGAEADQYKPIMFLRFTADAQEMFNDWRAELEGRIRSADEHPAVVSHLAKYRKLVPGLALINHLCEDGTGPVTETALARAVQFSEYLETHARRVYSYASRPDLEAAKTVVAKIKLGKIKPVFRLREIYNNGWSALTTPEEARAAVRMLRDYGYVREVETEPDRTGGRPSEAFQAHRNIRGLA